MPQKTSPRKRGPVLVYRNAEDDPGRSSGSSQHSHHSTVESSSGGSGGGNGHYKVSVMGQPPTQIPTGYPFQPSALVSKQSSSSSSRHHRSRTSSSSGSSSSSGGSIMAVVTLLGGDPSSASSSSVSPPRSGTLQGPRLASSVHDLPSDYRDSLPRDLAAHALGYVSFPNLQLTRPGTYRLRLSLIKLPPASSRTSSGSSSSRSRDTETVAYVDTHVFQVYDRAC